jgi:hypothetical protein
VEVVTCDGADLLLSAFVMGVAALGIQVAIGVTEYTLCEVATLPSVMSLVLIPLAAVFKDLCFFLPGIGEILDCIIMDRGGEFLGLSEVVEDMQFDVCVGTGSHKVGETDVGILAGFEEGSLEFSHFHGSSGGLLSDRHGSGRLLQ